MKYTLEKNILSLPEHPDLRFSLASPEDLDPGQRLPLVLVLHYAWMQATEVPPFYGTDLLTEVYLPALGSLKAIFAAPDCPEKDWANPSSAAALFKLINHLATLHPVNPARILLTGYSLGGAGVWYLAAHHPERFSAALPIAGWPPNNNIENLTQIPLYVLHSLDDDYISIEPTQRLIPRLIEKGADISFIPVAGITHFETFQYIDPLKNALPWIESHLFA